MTTVLERKRLRVTSHCHLPPIHIQVPHIAPDSTLFPAAAEGFEEYSVVPVVGWFGGRYQLVDISDLTRNQVKERVHADLGSGAQVEAIRFLQCLDWIHKDAYVHKFAFERIIAYPYSSEPVVAVRTEQGFKRVPYPGDEVPWEQGRYACSVLIRFSDDYLVRAPR